MTRMLTAAAFLAAASVQAIAQDTSDQLNDTQRTGRQLFAQSCGVCHLPPALNAHTYGPRLSKTTAGGSEEAIRAIMSEGSARMPAFKYNFERPQIDAIIAYLMTVPTPPPAPAR